MAWQLVCCLGAQGWLEKSRFGEALIRLPLLRARDSGQPRASLTTKPLG